MITMRGLIIPVFISVLLHAGIIVLMGANWSVQTPSKVERPNFVKATLVELKEKPKKKQAKKKPKKVDLTKRRKEQEKKKRDAEKKRQAALKKKKADEKKKREKKEREKEEAEAKLREQLRRQEELENAMLEEEQLLVEDEYETEAQSYKGAIYNRIRQNWSRPPSARNGMKCKLEIQLVPTGQVVLVTVTESSGNSAFDRSAEQAVKKVERFPEIKEMPPQVFERYYRKLIIVFNPQDLRQ